MNKESDRNVFSISPKKIVSDSICIGPRAGELLTSARRMRLIGIDAGADLTEGEDIIIIGDGIRNLDPHQNKDVMFIKDNVAIGNTLFGVEIGIKEMIEIYLRNTGSLK